jgi:hypothetical protein
LGACGDDDGDETTPQATTTTSTGPTATTADEPEGQPGDAPPSEPSDRDEQPTDQLERPLDVEDVIDAVLTDSGSPEQACEELVTERFVRTAYGSRQGCVAARAPGATAKSVKVEDVRESGDRATAIAVPTGGPYDGVDVEVALVADPALEGAWLLDSLLADVPAGP